MSRIYQGGGADRRFQSNKQGRRYNPSSVKGNIKSIQQAGQAAIEKLKTQDRERARANQLSDLERNNADRYAQLQLRQEQIQERAAFKMQQTVDQFELKNSQLEEKDRLAMQQFADKSKFELQQLGEKGNLKQQQLSEKINLKNDQMQENLELGLQRLTTQTNAQIQQAQMTADNATENANLAMQKAGVNALLAFADIAVKGAELGVQFAEQQEKQRQREAEDKALEWMFDSSNGPSVESAETTQNAIEIADEQGIQATGANPIERERMRQPYADSTMLRDIKQTDIGTAALQFPTQFDSYIYDPETKAFVNGEFKSLQDVLPGEEGLWLRSAAKDIIRQYGPLNRDSRAMVQKLGRAVNNSINAAYSQIASSKRALAKGLRWEAASGNAATELASGDTQRAYDILFRGVYSSGIGDLSDKPLTPKAAKDMAFNKLVELSQTPEQLKAILSVNSVTGQPNTAFGNQPEYERKIKAEITKRNNADYNYINSQQKLVTQQAEEIEYKANWAIMQAGSDADVLSIRKQAIEELRPLGIQALDAINRLQKAGSSNPAVYAALNEGFDIGKPPSTAQIMEAAANGSINTEQKNYLLKRGKTSDQITQTLTEAGLPSAREMLTTVTKAAMANANLSGPENGVLEETVVNAELEAYENDLRQIVINNEGQPSSVIQQKVQELNTRTQQRFYTNADKAVWERIGNTNTYQYKFGDKPKLAPYRRDESTGKANRSFINHTVEEIASHPQGASVNDAYLTDQQFLAAAEAWKTNSGYSRRVKAIAKKLGISPSSFVRRQSTVLGYGRIDKVQPPSRATGDLTIDPELKDALNVLHKYESKNGGYNAVNQGGTNQGRTPLGYSGDSSKSALFGYKGVSEMTIAEIQQRQNIGGARAQFEAAGGLHAVGRYQFIAPTLAWVVEKTGLSPDTKFTPEVQDYLAGWLLANSHNGIGQWVGPADKATPYERQIVAKARLKLQDAYRILQNPNATEIQVARAQRVVGNPFL